MTDTDRRQTGVRRPRTGERRAGSRGGRYHVLWDLVFRGLRAAGLRAGSFYATVGIFLVVGVVIAIGGTLAFAKLGELVREGGTQQYDVAALEWMGAHHTPLLTRIMTELTFLGTGTVVLTIVGVAAMFLWHTEHKHSARLLLASVAGGILLNNALKLWFSRPRPEVFERLTETVSSSFPSGHAMSATVCYGTVAYLVMRLQKRHWSRVLTGITAFILILGICTTRLYLGVHYPSDVIAGMVIGLAWAGFCMATLEASLVLARRRAPREVSEERRAPTEAA
jgi:membrane-associated phospholipid phosphatase